MKELGETLLLPVPCFTFPCDFWKLWPWVEGFAAFLLFSLSELGPTEPRQVD